MPSLKRTRSFYGVKDYASAPKKSRTLYQRRARKAFISVPRSSLTQFKASAPFKERARATLRYVEHVTLDAAVGAISSYLFSANGLYDPNITGVGHQPYGFDTYMTIYNHYLVKSARIKVEAMTSSPGVVAGMNHIGIAICDDTTVPTSTRDMVEQKGTTTAFMDSFNKAVCSNYWSKAMVFNADHDALSGNVGANPTEQTYFAIFQAHLSTGVEPGGMYFVVTIDYDTEFYELKSLGSS